MIGRFVQSLRNHLPVLLIVPLVVIATTWPTFPRIFDADEFWLHVRHHDKWLTIWEAWHIERALSGQSDLYYTDSMYHPPGLSLAYQPFDFPHALLLVASKAILPVDDAYNLLFLLILCFNAFCGYTLIRHLIEDKWIALFGAVVFAAATPFPFGQTIPDLITIGTLPLAMYFYLRAESESNWRFAILAGISAGVTAFIGVYVFGFILLSVGIYVFFISVSQWREPAFWRRLLLFLVVCASISALRFYPMFADRAHLTLGLEAYQDKSRSNDLLEHFVLVNNPFTGEFFREALNASPDYETSGIRPEYKEAYLGYINLFLIAFAILRAPQRRRLLPWIVTLLFFAILRLGHYFTFNDLEYVDVVLPKYFLTKWFPALFGNIGFPEYYQIGVVMPLAVLACFGLAALLQSKPVKARMLAALLCILIVCIEFYTPRLGQTLEPDKTAFVAWLQSEPDDPIKLIHLPLSVGPKSFYLYVQTLTGYPHANGHSSRLKHSARHYILGNLLLRSWDESRSVHCLPHNEQSFTAALEQLLADGFTHVVVHNWLYGDQFIIHTFENVPAAYDDGYVSVYRVRDLRLSCQNQAAELPRFIHFAQSASAAPGRKSAILSLHPSQPIDPDRFDYLGSLFSDWASLLHLYRDDGELATQNAGLQYADLEAFVNDNQVINLLYNTRDGDPELLIGNAIFDGFDLCQREAHDDGAVIERYVSRDFSCELIIAGNPFQVQYDNGVRLENLAVQANQDVLDLQFMWSNLPDEAHSVSIQVFNAAGAKVAGHDYVIGNVSLDRFFIDFSDLATGKHEIKLIVYEFSSGRTIAGTVSSDGARFDRELTIATLDRFCYSLEKQTNNHRARKYVTVRNAKGTYLSQQMIRRIAQTLRNHWPLLLIVPLVVIATTWPTFPRIFDADEFWLHVVFRDKWLRIWDAWHFEQVLAGQTELYYTNSIFHPSGTSLAFYSLSFPHALLLIALKTVLPVDDAYNLLFLLILCFNAFCGYALIQHLIRDKWISIFGAVVFVVATPFPSGQTVPDLIMIGTLPLTLYLVIRSIRESRWRFAALAGLCAGFTAFIGVYIFAFILFTVGIFALFQYFRLWRQPTFWRALLIFVVACGLTSVLRFYPMLLNRAQLQIAVEAYEERSRSNDLLEHFVLPNNPFTGRFFGEPLDPRDDYEHSVIRREYKEAYLGYVNLILIACAFMLQPRRRRLLPWIVILLFFAIFRLGSYLTLNGIHYTDFALPEGLLRAWFPFLFRSIGNPEYYQIGVVTPLAVLSCYGLAALLRSKGAKSRRLVALLCIFIVCVEFYTPRLGQTLERNKTAFVAWLQSEPDDQIKLVHLPLAQVPRPYFHYLQTLTGYPIVDGSASRLSGSARSYLYDNFLLHRWKSSRSIHCLKHNEPSFTAALEQLLDDGFTHIVVHNWFYGDQFIIQSFKNVPPAYDNGYVSIYRVEDMRLSCQNQGAELPRFIQLALSPSATPGSQSAILSLHPDQPIDPDLFDYLGSLFSDWRSLAHLYLDDGELVMQSAGKSYPDLDAFTEDNQVIHLLYNTRDADRHLLNNLATFDDFNLCQREAGDSGAIVEHYVRREFSCELVTSASGFTAQYENGARLENLLFAIDQDQLDLQFQWSSLPDEVYSVSVQVFDASGETVLGQDSVIGHVTLARHRVDVSALPPGDYGVKLIMYNFESGAVVSGTESRNGARFDRALEVGTIHRQ